MIEPAPKKDTQKACFCHCPQPQGFHIEASAAGPALELSRFSHCPAATAKERGGQTKWRGNKRIKQHCFGGQGGVALKSSELGALELPFFSIGYCTLASSFRERMTERKFRSQLTKPDLALWPLRSAHQRTVAGDASKLDLHRRRHCCTRRKCVFHPLASYPATCIPEREVDSNKHNQKTGLQKDSCCRSSAFVLEVLRLRVLDASAIFLEAFLSKHPRCWGYSLDYYG